MDPMLLWAIALLMVGLLLVMAEVFIPSGGILGFLAVMAVIASIILAFASSGSNTGIIFTMIAVIGMPAALIAALKWWPNTAMGRKFLLDAPAAIASKEEQAHLASLLGKIGTAKTMMLPGGTVQIEGETYEAVSEGTSIEADQSVEVVQVRHIRLVVRPSDQSPPPFSQDPQQQDILSQPIESVGLDPLDDPLA